MINVVENAVYVKFRPARKTSKVSSAVDHTRSGPALGADTADILHEVLGYSAETIALLREQGVL